MHSNVYISESYRSRLTVLHMLLMQLFIEIDLNISTPASMARVMHVCVCVSSSLFTEFRKCTAWCTEQRTMAPTINDAFRWHFIRPDIKVHLAMRNFNLFWVIVSFFLIEINAVKSLQMEFFCLNSSTKYSVFFVGSY